MVKIINHVGKNAHGQNEADIKKIQITLKAIKDNRRKPYYQGREDGRCGPKTIAAIECFQMDNKIKVSGKVESYGQTINRLTQKAPYVEPKDYRVYLVAKRAFSNLPKDIADAGHVFIGGIKPDGTPEAYGFYPDDTISFHTLYESKTEMKGKIKDNNTLLQSALSGDSDFNFIMFHTNATTYMDVMTYIKSYAANNDYGLFTNSCVHAAFKALNSVGLITSTGYPTGSLPAGIFDMIPMIKNSIEHQ